MNKKRMKSIRTELYFLEIKTDKKDDQRDLGTILHLLDNIIYRNFLE